LLIGAKEESISYSFLRSNPLSSILTESSFQLLLLFKYYFIPPNNFLLPNPSPLIGLGETGIIIELFADLEGLD
jgi:hypothetical protein